MYDVLVRYVDGLHAPENAVDANRAAPPLVRTRLLTFHLKYYLVIVCLWCPVSFQCPSTSCASTSVLTPHAGTVLALPGSRMLTSH